MPDDAGTQTKTALSKALTVVKSAGGTADNIVEITSYHLGLRSHFDAVQDVIQDLLGTPLPAWTAVEVAGLRRPGALVEFRIVAHLGT